MEIKKEELISYTFFSKIISEKKTVLGIQKINSDDKPLLIDILSEDIIIDKDYLIYRSQNYLLETLEIILYDGIPYLCESFTQKSLCRMPDQVVKYLSFLNTFYYGFTIENNKYFISKISNNEKIIADYPFKKYPHVSIYQKNNIYYIRKKNKEFLLTNADFFEDNGYVIMAIYNTIKRNYAIIGYISLK